jgi:Tfp pilus assembly protein PilF
VCLELARKSGSVADAATTLNNLGNLDWKQNRMEEARKAYEEALKIYVDFAKTDPDQFSPHAERVKRLLVEIPERE